MNICELCCIETGINKLHAIFPDKLQLWVELPKSQSICYMNQVLFYSRVLICPFTFLPDNTKIHAFCVFWQENEWTNKNSTVVQRAVQKNL